MYRTRRTNKKIIPEVGDDLFSNLGNRMLHVVEDSYGEQNRYLLTICSLFAHCIVARYVNKTYSYRSYTESDAEDVHQECRSLALP